MFEVLRSVCERVRAWWEYRQAWEVVNRDVYYNRVVRQASGYVVHVYERETEENRIDGARRERMESEVDTVWLPCDSTWWRPGSPLEWGDEEIESADELLVFGNVARGYRR